MGGRCDCVRAAVSLMLRSCPKCGRIHDAKFKCVKDVRPKTRQSEFRNTRAWRRLRDFVRERDGNLCVACLHEDPPRYEWLRLSVHHIVPIAEDWDARLDEDNCITLCPYHHERAECGDISRSKLFEWISESECIGKSPRV